MKQLFLLSLVIFAVGCNNHHEIITGDLKSSHVGKVVMFKNSNQSYTWHVIEGSDSHEYMENDGGNPYVLIHYPGCVKCQKDTIK